MLTSFTDELNQSARIAWIGWHGGVRPDKREILPDVPRDPLNL